MADYWMKLYIEILDDPKMATMPDRVWRRTVELFLVAKKLNKDGHLPGTRQIAWLLRMSDEELDHDMIQIASTGIIIQELGGWYIPNFIKRQSAVGGAERVAQFRKREQKQEYYDSVTTLKRNVTQNTETDTETETETELVVVGDTGSIFRIYEQEIGLLTPAIREKILDAETLYPNEWMIDAMKESAKNNKRFWGYTEGILKSWKRDGKGNGSSRGYSPAMTVEEKLNIAFAKIGSDPEIPGSDRRSLGESPTITTPSDRRSPKDTTLNTPSKDSSEHKKMFGALTLLCQLDPNLKSGYIGKTAKTLVGAGYTTEDLEVFTQWWKARDFRGMKGESPALANVVDNILKAKQEMNPPIQKELKGHTEMDENGYYVFVVDKESENV